MLTDIRLEYQPSFRRPPASRSSSSPSTITGPRIVEICNPTIADLQKHGWWPRVVGKGAEAQKGASTQSILGKRKVAKSAERAVEKGESGEKMEIDDIRDEEERGKEKAEGKRRARSDDRREHRGDNMERGRPRQRQRLERSNL